MVGICSGRPRGVDLNKGYHQLRDHGIGSYTDDESTLADDARSDRDAVD
jgi:hypothetical protein